MIKLIYEMGDVKVEIERNENGSYQFSAVSEEDNKRFTKEMSEDEIACILFASFDVDYPEDSKEIYKIARLALQDAGELKDQIVP